MRPVSALSCPLLWSVVRWEQLCYDVEQRAAAFTHVSCGSPTPLGRFRQQRTMNMVQVSIGGRAVLVPVTTIGGLATGMGAIANALQPCRSLDSGQSSSLTRSSLSVSDSVASPGVAVHSSHASGASDEDDEMESHDNEIGEVQDMFTELLEVFDASAPSSQQQHRAMNNLWSFYAAHADELEACAPELEAMLSSRLVLAPGQTAFARVSISPSDLSQQKLSSSKFNRSECTSLPKWSSLHRRSRSMT